VVNFSGIVVQRGRTATSFMFLGTQTMLFGKLIETSSKRGTHTGAIGIVDTVQGMVGDVEAHMIVADPVEAHGLV
jgi:hypothetical protein